MFDLKVVGLARHIGKIEITAGKLSKEPGKLYAKQCDMTVEEDIKAVFEWTTKTLGPVHILINSAGVNPGTDIISGDTEKWSLCFDTNVIGVTTASREAVKIMLEKKIDGHIVNVNAIVGHCHMYLPSMSLYSASKHALTSMTELLRQELSGCGVKNNIKVTSISPGATRTEFINDDTRATLGEATKNMAFLSSEEVTDATMYVLATPARVHINELIMVAKE